MEGWKCPFENYWTKRGKGWPYLLRCIKTQSPVMQGTLNSASSPLSPWGKCSILRGARYGMVSKHEQLDLTLFKLDQNKGEGWPYLWCIILLICCVKRTDLSEGMTYFFSKSFNFEKGSKSFFNKRLKCLRERGVFWIWSKFSVCVTVNYEFRNLLFA